jgi:hypothetical protein
MRVKPPFCYGHNFEYEREACIVCNPPTFTGYDGNGYGLHDRVELHPGCDLWMRGARYGEVVGCSRTPADRVHVRLDNRPGSLVKGYGESFRGIPDND